VALTGDDCREGLVAIISIKLPDPKFNSQAKHKLISGEAKGPIEAAINEQLSKFFEEKPYVAKNVISKMLLSARAREAARKAKDLTRKKNAIDSFSLAGKLSDCQSKRPEESEVFIVEGDSAGGSCKMGRDRRIQAVLPLRGKILNVEKVEQNKMIDNNEIKNIIATLGVGVGKNVNIDNLRYHKVIIMCDADSDGKHIACLLMTFFYRYMRPLIEGGYLYLAQPPLYKLKRGKSERYIQSDQEMDNLLIDSGLKDIKVKRGTKTIKEDELREIFNLVLAKGQIVGAAERAVGNSRLLPAVASMNLKPHKMNNKEFLKEEIIKLRGKLKNIDGLRAGFCFLETGGFEIVYTTQMMDDQTWKYMLDGYMKKGIKNELLFSCAVTKEFVNSESIKSYKLLQELSGASLVMTEKGTQSRFNSWGMLINAVRERGAKGIAVQRYKGLGEMNPVQLWDTTMDPGSRTLLQLNIEDAQSADYIFDLLMGGSVEPRKEFIEQNALNARNLDI